MGQMPYFGAQLSCLGSVVQPLCNQNVSGNEGNVSLYQEDVQPFLYSVVSFPWGSRVEFKFTCQPPRDRPRR